MNRHLHRAWLLLESSRLELAKHELRKALADEPDLADAHALLAICLSQGEDYAAAFAAAEQATELAPDRDLSHYAMAVVYWSQSRFAEAERSIREAIRLDPSDAAHFALLADIQGKRSHWSSALEAASHGLMLDPCHQSCMRVRATAMLMLGDKESARHQTRALLRLDPEDARSQALLGRLDMLHGANREGRERIREALRIDPELFGRLPGVAEELKARSLFYKVVLRCLSLMIRARACAVLGVTAGRTPTRLAIVVAAAVLLVSVNAIGEWVRFSPDVPPIVKWSTALVVASVILTWNARPIYLTTIGVTRLGRTAIPRDLLVWSSTAVALILSATVLLAHYVLTGNKTAGAIALISWIAVYPLAAVHKCQRGWPRWGLLSVSFGTAIGGSVLVGHEAAAVPVGQVTNVIVVLLIGSRLAVWWLKRT